MYLYLRYISKVSSPTLGVTVADQACTSFVILSCWDWGMGWGWTGLNAAFCGTCAMEQAALTNHLPGLQHSHQSTSSLPAAMDSSAQQQVSFIQQLN